MKSQKKDNKKTALVLSGGGSRGAYEAGACQALAELGIDIDIITGTSVGAINAAMMTQDELELATKLWKEMETHMVFDVPEGSQPFDYAREIVFNHGAGTSGLKALMDKYIDENKIRNSKLDMGITAVSLPDFKPHFLFMEDIPEGKVIDYIMASASAFPAIHSYPIDGTEFIDGGYADGIPVDMAVKRGATQVIVVNLRGFGKINQDAIKNAPDMIWIESPWDLGFQFVFDLDNTRLLLRLGYLDTMKAYGVLDGGYYAFARGAFDKITTKMADACAKVFDMDPTLIYTRDIFMEKLSAALKASQKDAEEALARHKKTPFILMEAKDVLKDIKSVASDNVVTFLIAYNLKEKGEKSPFLSRAAHRLMPEPILAARFLVKYNLL
ncbi:MAG: patatin-like phospholipase family protein [Firmicutes bacterium]|nr:patatin-like phospholipase family protein [Bacillota bacterium]